MPGCRLSLGEREEIRVGLVAGESLRGIARRIGRDATTVWRELRRNSSERGYVAHVAQFFADDRARRPRRLRLEVESGLARRVRKGLRMGKSPGWIAAELRTEGIGLSTETIYAACYHPSRPLGADSHRLLCRPRRGRIRRRRTSSGRIVKPLGDYKPLAERPGDPHLEAGHWEGDLIVGDHNRTVAAVLVERQTRFCLLGALPGGRKSRHVARVVSRLLNTVPPQLRCSLTWDQGTELARWKDIEAATGTPVFFAEPRSPWRRPLVENTCGLIRRWLKRNRPITSDQRILTRIQNLLNQMPRRILQGRTAAEAYDQLRVATAD